MSCSVAARSGARRTTALGGAGPGLRYRNVQVLSSGQLHAGIRYRSGLHNHESMQAQRKSPPAFEYISVGQRVC